MLCHGRLGHEAPAEHDLPGGLASMSPSGFCHCIKKKNKCENYLASFKMGYGLVWAVSHGD